MVAKKPDIPLIPKAYEGYYPLETLRIPAEGNIARMGDLGIFRLFIQVFYLMCHSIGIEALYPELQWIIGMT